MNGSSPAHPVTEGEQPAERRTRHQNHRRVLGVQVRQRAEVVGHHRAALTTLLPVAAEHEVLHDQLAPAVDQVDQADRTAFGVEHIRFDHLDHGQATPRRAHRVLQPHQLLLPGPAVRRGRAPTPARIRPCGAGGVQVDDGAGQPRRATHLHRRRPHRQHRLGHFLPRPDPLHHRDLLRHLPDGSVPPDLCRPTRSPRACRRRRSPPSTVHC